MKLEVYANVVYTGKVNRVVCLSDYSMYRVDMYWDLANRLPSLVTVGYACSIQHHKNKKLC